MPPANGRGEGGRVADGTDAADRRRLRAFGNHLIVYFAAMALAVPANFLLAPETPWFLFPLVAWGAPLAIHAAWAMNLFGRRG